NLNDPTAMLFYLWLDDGAPKRLPLREGAFLVRLDEPTVPSDIRRQNGSEPSLDALAGQAPILFVEYRYPGQFTPFGLRAARARTWRWSSSAPRPAVLLASGMTMTSMCSPTAARSLMRRSILSLSSSFAS